MRSNHYKQRAASAGQKIFILEVRTDSTLSPGDSVNVEILHIPWDPSPTVAMGATVIKIEGPGPRFRATFALNRKEAQKIIDLGKDRYRGYALPPSYIVTLLFGYSGVYYFVYLAIRSTSRIGSLDRAIVSTC